jgi:Subtilase family
MSICARRTWVISLTVAGALAAGGGPATAQDAVPEELEQRALQIVAEEQGTSPRALTLAASTPSDYPLQGEHVFDFKVADREGRVHGVTLDREGSRLEGEKLADAERAARLDRYGRLDPRLAERLETAAGDERFDVLLWLDAPATAYDRPALGGPDTTLKDLASFYDEIDAARARDVAEVTRPVLERLAGLGIEATADSHAPVVYATLPVDLLRELSSWEEIDTVYEAGTNEPEVEVSVPTVRGDAVKGLGINGAGVNVAQIEAGGRVATGNPHLAGVTQDATSVCAAASAHSTAVAGIIRSRHFFLPPPFTGFTREGMAPGVNLRAAGSCAETDGELQDRSTAAANAGSSALNLSWGRNIGLTPGANDRFYDDMVMNRARTVVKSAGNQNGACGAGNGNVTSPGLAYNVTAVGNFNDGNTAGWNNDVMAGCSSFRDPSSTHNDREKPEVSAPGENITSTTTGFPFTGPVGSGTSFAAPLVTGDAAMLIQRVPSLGFFPETIKAIQMATAMHNIEGATRLSEFDGAGGIDALRADSVARRSGGNHGGQRYTCGATSPLAVHSTALTAGRTTRAVIAWDNDTTWPDYANRPAADLDLQVVGPNGNVVASSLSWDNTYEVAEFTPAVSGTHTLRVVKFRCDRPTWLGWAWRQG